MFEFLPEATSHEMFAYISIIIGSLIFVRLINIQSTSAIALCIGLVLVLIYSNYVKKTNDGKKILRSVMKNYIPEKIINAKKQGFSSPDASWFKGESIDFVKGCLLNKEAFIYNFLDRDQAHNLVNQHLKGEKNRRLLIWSFLNINRWLELTFN